MAEDFAEKIIETFGSLTKTLEQIADCAKMLRERIEAIEKRQDLLWEALQGLVQVVSKQEENLTAYREELAAWLKK